MNNIDHLEKQLKEIDNQLQELFDTVRNMKTTVKLQKQHERLLFSVDVAGWAINDINLELENYQKLEKES